MRTVVTTVTTLALLAFVLAGSAAAQDSAHRGSLKLTAGAGWTSLWDDETFLGRGVIVGGGVAAPLGAHAAIEAELAGATHHRDAGYLAADGAPFIGTGRLAYYFRSPTAHVRPFASVGLAIVHSTGHFTTKSFVPDARGLPIEGAPTRTDWSITRGAYELGGGVSIASGPTVALRPEFRWTTTGGETRPSVVEPPIWVLRAGVTVEWRIRR